jgi:hypothetical protein
MANFQRYAQVIERPSWAQSSHCHSVVSDAADARVHVSRNTTQVMNSAADRGKPWSAAFVVSGHGLRCYPSSMRKDDEKQIAADLAKVIAMMCVRNSKLENIHAGLVPITRTGDYSDVVVLDADGRRIPWTEVSHIDDSQMRDLMKDIVNRLYTFQMRSGEPEFQAWIDRWARMAAKWDEPELLRPSSDPDGA